MASHTHHPIPPKTSPILSAHPHIRQKFLDSIPPSPSGICTSCRGNSVVAFIIYVIMRLFHGVITCFSLLGTHVSRPRLTSMSNFTSLEWMNGFYIFCSIFSSSVSRQSVSWRVEGWTNNTREIFIYLFNGAQITGEEKV